MGKTQVINTVVVVSLFAISIVLFFGVMVNQFGLNRKTITPKETPFTLPIQQEVRTEECFFSSKAQIDSKDFRGRIATGVYYVFTQLGLDKVYISAEQIQGKIDPSTLTNTLRYSITYNEYAVFLADENGKHTIITKLTSITPAKKPVFTFTGTFIGSFRGSDLDKSMSRNILYHCFNRPNIKAKYCTETSSFYKKTKIAYSDMKKNREYVIKYGSLFSFTAEIYNLSDIKSATLSK